MISLGDAEAVLAAPAPRLCPPERAAEYARHLGLALPTGKDTDFDIWITDATVLLCHYAERDVREVMTHPVLGLKAEHDWLPAVSKVKAELDARAARRARIIGSARWVAAYHAERRATETQLSGRPMATGHQLENLSREIKGLRSLDDAERVRDQQREFNAYATFRGGGDYCKGLQILIEEGTEVPPDGWRSIGGGDASIKT